MDCLGGDCNQSTAKICSARYLSTRGSHIRRSGELRIGSVLSRRTGVIIEIFQFYHFRRGGSLKPKKKTRDAPQQLIVNSNCCDALLASRSARRASTASLSPAGQARASINGAPGGDGPELLDAVAADTDIPVVEVDGGVAMAGDQADLVADLEAVGGAGDAVTRASYWPFIRRSS